MFTGQVRRVKNIVPHMENFRFINNTNKQQVGFESTNLGSFRHKINYLISLQSK